MQVNMEPLEFENRINITRIVDEVMQIKKEIGRIVIGQQHLVDMLLVSLLADGHLLLEGVPGVAKTLTAKLIAHTIDTGFCRLQFTPDLMPSDVLGTNLFNPQQVKFEFKPGPIFSNIVLIDEINRAPAKTQSSLFEVMEERSVSVDGTTYPMQEPFMIIATQNPIDHEGTYQLPEAQLDRFLMKIIVGYPTLEQEVLMLQNFTAMQNMHDQISTVNKKWNVETLMQLRELVSQIRVEENILHFIAKVVGDTRNHPALYLGASPRASIALLKASKALAAISGRDFVTPEDVIGVACPVLRHRISLTPEKEMDGVLPDDIITEIVKQNDIPR
jgi:MoxR-like ATPase